MSADNKEPQASSRESVAAWQREAVQTPNVHLKHGRSWIGRNSQEYFRGSLRAQVLETLSGKRIAGNFNNGEIGIANDNARDDSQAKAQIQSRLRLEVFRQLAETLLVQDESYPTPEDETITEARYLYFNKLAENTVTRNKYLFRTYQEGQKLKIPGQKQENFNDQCYPRTKVGKDSLTRAATREGLLLPLAYAIYGGDEEDKQKGTKAGENRGRIREALFPFIGTDAKELSTQLDHTLQAMEKTTLFSDIIVSIVVPSNQKTELAARTVMNEWRERLDVANLYPNMQVRFVTLPIFPDEINSRADSFGKPSNETLKAPVRETIITSQPVDMSATTPPTVPEQTQVQTTEKSTISEEPANQKTTTNPPVAEVIFVQPTTEIEPEAQATSELEKTEPIPSLTEQAFQYFCSIEASAQAKDPGQLLRYIEFLASEGLVAVLQTHERVTDKKEGFTQVIGKPAILGVAEHINESLMGQIGRGNARINDWLINEIQTDPEHKDIVPRTLFIDGDTLMLVYLMDTRDTTTDITDNDYFVQIREAMSLATGLSQETLEHIEADMKDLRARGKTEVVYKPSAQTLLAIIGSDIVHKEYETILQKELSRAFVPSAPRETILGLNQAAEEAAQMDESLVTFLNDTIPKIVGYGVSPEELQETVLPQMKASLIGLQIESEQITQIKAKEIVREVREKLPLATEQGLFISVSVWNEYIKGLPRAVRELISEEIPELAIHVASIGDYAPVRLSYIEEIQEVLDSRYQPETLARYKTQLEKRAQENTDEAKVATALLAIATNEEQLHLLQAGKPVTLSPLTKAQTDRLLFDLILDDTVVKKSLLSEAIEHTYKVSRTQNQNPERDYDLERMYVRLVLDSLDNVQLSTLLAPAVTMQTVLDEATKNAHQLEQIAKRAKNDKKAQQNAAEAKQEIPRIRERIRAGETSIWPATRIISVLEQRIILKKPIVREYMGGANAKKYQEALQRANTEGTTLPDEKDYDDLGEISPPLALLRDVQERTALMELGDIRKGGRKEQPIAKFQPEFSRVDPQRLNERSGKPITVYSANEQQRTNRPDFSSGIRKTRK